MNFKQCLILLFEDKRLNNNDDPTRINKVNKSNNKEVKKFGNLKMI